MSLSTLPSLPQILLLILVGDLYSQDLVQLCQRLSC
jgi:hypothetical protein